MNDFDRVGELSAARFARERHALPSPEILAGIERAILSPPPSSEIAAILDARKASHGDFSDDALASQRLKAAMRDTRNWNALSEIQREALEQIATKIGRILSGDANHRDGWVDIQGYARLVEERLG
jgi:hypothetical protein